MRIQPLIAALTVLFVVDTLAYAIPAPGYDLQKRSPMSGRSQMTGKMKDGMKTVGKKCAKKLGLSSKGDKDRCSQPDVTSSGPPQIPDDMDLPGASFGDFPGLTGISGKEPALPSSPRAASVSAGSIEGYTPGSSSPHGPNGKPPSQPRYSMNHGSRPLLSDQKGPKSSPGQGYLPQSGNGDPSALVTGVTNKSPAFEELKRTSLRMDGGRESTDTGRATLGSSEGSDGAGPSLLFPRRASAGSPRYGSPGPTIRGSSEALNSGSRPRNSGGGLSKRAMLESDDLDENHFRKRDLPDMLQLNDHRLEKRDHSSTDSEDSPSRIIKRSLDMGKRTIPEETTEDGNHFEKRDLPEDAPEERHQIEKRGLPEEENESQFRKRGLPQDGSDNAQQLEKRGHLEELDSGEPQFEKRNHYNTGSVSPASRIIKRSSDMERRARPDEATDLGGAQLEKRSLPEDATEDANQLEKRGLPENHREDDIQFRKRGLPEIADNESQFDKRDQYSTDSDPSLSSIVKRSSIMKRRSFPDQTLDVDDNQFERRSLPEETAEDENHLQKRNLPEDTAEDKSQFGKRALIENVDSDQLQFEKRDHYGTDFSPSRFIKRSFMKKTKELTKAEMRNVAANVAQNVTNQLRTPSKKPPAVPNTKLPSATDKTKTATKSAVGATKSSLSTKAKGAKSTQKSKSTSMDEDDFDDTPSAQTGKSKLANDEDDMSMSDDDTASESLDDSDAEGLDEEDGSMLKRRALVKRNVEGTEESTDEDPA